MEEKIMLRLKKGVSPALQEGPLGLSWNGKTRIARDNLQERVLWLLLEREQSPDELETAIQACGADHSDSLNTALALAGFILDFGDYLDTDGAEAPKKTNG
ncbi:MAG: hypothetical protein LKJ86_09525 [Oscillibacter sp.]|jgi:hypothetical protein|nr:hypothetical protein [Oscillibacter sp.]